MCCWRPNPALQLFYVALMAGGFALFYHHVLPLLHEQCRLPRGDDANFAKAVRTTHAGHACLVAPRLHEGSFGVRLAPNGTPIPTIAAYLEEHGYPSATHYNGDDFVALINVASHTGADASNIVDQIGVFSTTDRRAMATIMLASADFGRAL